MKESKIMTDAQSLSKLRSMEHWVAKEPWGQIADRFEEMSLKELNELEQKVLSIRATNLDINK